MIGIDAPESNTARYGYTECYGKEAKEYLEKLLTRANTVQIEMDASQGATDKYGRLLGYVFYDDENINKKMITEGYAREYTYDGEYKYKKEFDEAEKYARKRVNGLRYVNTCGGVRVSTDEQKAQKEKEEAERKVEQEKYLKEYEAKEVERKRQEALNNSSSYSSSSNSSSSSSSKCSGHIWHT
ncbi:MAG: thermonuclease family protein [Candidatus Peribacteria bacterium]|jgi:micrococcal nuclease|nr:thermonuclease family protein [Candidatus Peribacteria bacterium]